MPGLQIDAHPTVIATLAPEYAPLFERVLAVTTTDERIRGLWLSGSLARGVSDSGSDLDLIVAVRDEDFADFAQTWQDWLAGITPTLIAHQLGAQFHGFYSTTPQFCRLDVVGESVSTVPQSPHRRRLVVFDRDGLDAQVPAPEPGVGPDPVKIEQLVEEYLRIAAIFPAAVIAREDVLLGAEGVHSNQVMLYQLFVEANQPLPPMGIKQWSSKLTPEQRQVFLDLPPLAFTRESVGTAMLATFEAFRTAGRAAAEAAGAVWPDQLERAVTEYLRAQISG